MPGRFLPTDSTEDPVNIRNFNDSTFSIRQDTTLSQAVSWTAGKGCGRATDTR